MRDVGDVKGFGQCWTTPGAQIAHKFRVVGFDIEFDRATGLGVTGILDAIGGGLERPGQRIAKMVRLAGAGGQAEDQQ